MSILYALIPLALVLAGLAIWAFFWAVRNEQFDDLDTPATMILLDDGPLVERGKPQGGEGEKKVE